MHVSQLSLTHYRNYGRLGLDLDPGVLVFQGQNGQGKTNLLEAVYVLATTKSPRTSSERQLVEWRDPESTLDPAVIGPPFARLEARVKREHEGEVHLELLLKGGGEPAEEPSPDIGAIGEITGRLARSIKVNGLPTKAADLIGRLTVVYFAPEDVALASGPPAGRRRYLDLANSQVAPLYLRALQQFNRILLQRNHVLRQVRERRQPLSAVEPWTEQLVRTGVYILRHRRDMLAAINQSANGIFRDLSGLGKEFRIAYRPTVTDADGGEADASTLAVAYRERLASLAQREVEQAATLAGPHRDDFSFLMDEVDLNSYGSRGQQRLAVLALKLAEAEWMRAQAGVHPVMLLDDLLSELDPVKRGYVLARVAPSTTQPDGRQVWITATDTDDFPAALLESAQRFYIDAGSVRRA